MPQVVDFFLLGEETRRAFGGRVHSPQAEIIAAAFDQNGREFVGDDAAEEGQVFLEELFLEADGVGGDDDAAAGFGRI